MKAPEKGDRVAVEFEGYVLLTDMGNIKVRADSSPTDMWVDSSVAMVLAPPVKVGDVVDGNNIQQLPDFSIIAADDGAAWVKKAGAWHFGEQTMQHHEVINRGDQRVLRIGGAS